MRSSRTNGKATSDAAHSDYDPHEHWTPEDPLLNQLYTAAEREGRHRHLTRDEVIDVAMNALTRSLEGHHCVPSFADDDASTNSSPPASDEEREQIAQSAARSAGRAHKRDHEQLVHLSEVSIAEHGAGEHSHDTQDPPYAMLLKTEFRDAVQRALSPKDADLFWKRFAEGQSLVELARLQGVRPGTLGKRLARMLPAIRAALERADWDDTGPF